MNHNEVFGRLSSTSKVNLVVLVSMVYAVHYGLVGRITTSPSDNKLLSI